jgi:hypothetical protein
MVRLRYFLICSSLPEFESDLNLLVIVVAYNLTHSVIDTSISNAETQVSQGSVSDVDTRCRVPHINSLDDVIRLWEQAQPENGFVPLKEWARCYGRSTYGETDRTKLSQMMYIYTEWKDHCNADRAVFEARFPNCSSLGGLHLKVTKAREARGEVRHRKGA